MAELALLAFFAVSLLVEYTDYCLRIHAEWHLLYLDRLKQFRCFSLGLFRSSFLLFSLRFLGIFSFLIWCLGLSGL